MNAALAQALAQQSACPALTQMLLYWTRFVPATPFIIKVLVPVSTVIQDAEFAVQVDVQNAS